MADEKDPKQAPTPGGEDNKSDAGLEHESEAAKAAQEAAAAKKDEPKGKSAEAPKGGKKPQFSKAVEDARRTGTIVLHKG